MAADEIDEELLLGIRQARRKPRNFAIIAKGPEVLHVLISRKPIRTGAAQAAKRAFHGNAVYVGACYGGDGNEFIFEVVGEEPLIPEVKLKRFLVERTGLPLKPRFVVTAEIGEIDDEEDA
jgi:hypothetical protein